MIQYMIHCPFWKLCSTRRLVSQSAARTIRDIAEPGISRTSQSPYSSEWGLSENGVPKIKMQFSWRE